MLFTTEQQYHLSCDSCGRTWWDLQAFPSYCPYCKTNRTPKLLREILTKRKLMMNDEKCPYYKGVCGIDEQYLCYCSSTPNGCNIYKKFLEEQIRKASNQ